MTPLLVLAIWAGLGSLAAVTLSPGNKTWGWIPMAVFAGPLWAAIALEQRADTPPID